MLPVLVAPFLCLAFYALGGGRGGQEDGAMRGAGMGFNTELPAPVFKKKEEKTDKLGFYKQADADSMKRREWRLQDPYYTGSKPVRFFDRGAMMKDTQATGLLKKLDLLKKRLDKPVGAERVHSVKEKKPVDDPEKIYPEKVYMPEMMSTLARRTAMPVERDPELDRLSEMLDKLVRLKGMEDQRTGGTSIKMAEETKRSAEHDQVMTAAVPAVVESDQDLVNGGTIGLRLMATVVCNGVTVRKGQLVYGTVSLSGDRLQVGVHSIRVGDGILATSWQVYDLDGLQGIRVPDGLGRQVARQSVDQGIGSLNLLGYDPSIGAQVAGVGIQAAKGLFSRKVRTVRVTVPAGYHVLLKDTKTTGGTMQVVEDTVAVRVRDSVVAGIKPPCIDSLQGFLHEKVRAADVCLQLRGIYQRDGLFWLYMVLQNEGTLPYAPGLLRCGIEPVRHFRRTAVQVLPLEPVYDGLPGAVAGGRSSSFLVGLPMFEVSKDKRLVVQLGESARSMKLGLKVCGRLFNKMRLYE